MGGEVTNMRALVTVLCSLVVVVACGKARVGTIPASGDYEALRGASRSRSVERSLPLGTPSSFIPTKLIGLVKIAVREGVTAFTSIGALREGNHHGFAGVVRT
jgi:hypothetical protein